MTKVSENPLVVDLDGTLTRSDLLYESFGGLIKLNIFNVLRVPFWLAKGKAHMKRRIAERVDVDIELLPWNKEFLEYLKAEKISGRRLILATASDEKYAHQIADYIGLFDDVIASDGVTNVSGKRKVAKARELLGDEPFDYAGNAEIDLQVWAEADKALLVNAEAGLEARLDGVAPIERVFDDKASQLKMFIKAIRAHQWLKNLLIFVPLILSYQFFESGQDISAVLAFIAFSLCASSVYLLNDILDLSADRQHPRKKRRPFASGNLSIVTGFVTMGAFLLISFLICFLLPPAFFLALLLYYVLTMAYSTVLKRAAIVDVLTLAALYTMRLIAGAAAISVDLSFWLLAFSMFIFLSLALIKRYSELLMQVSRGQDFIAGRAYRPVDLETLSQMGATSGYLAVMVLALYIESDAVNANYSHPEALWLLCPMMLYWISRLWLITRRGQMHDDPVVFTITDRRTYTLAAAAVAVLVAGVIV